jgi:hypothetical protein
MKDSQGVKCFRRGNAHVTSAGCRLNAGLVVPRRVRARPMTHRVRCRINRRSTAGRARGRYRLAHRIEPEKGYEENNSDGGNAA